MKRGWADHPKIMMLAGELSIPEYSAAGLHAMLIAFTQKHTPAGNIGKFCNQIIAKQVTWDGDADALIAALVKVRLLDEDPEHRLTVHDWIAHADDATHMQLARACEHFHDASRPKLTRFSKAEQARITKAYEEREKSRGTRTPSASKTHGAHTDNARKTHGAHTQNAPLSDALPSHPLPSPAPPCAAPPSQSTPQTHRQTLQPTEKPVEAETEAEAPHRLNGHHSASASASNSTSPAGKMLTRNQARTEFALHVSRIWADQGTPQYNADRSSTGKLFSQHIWPENEPPEKAIPIFEHALELIDDAAEAGEVPMAYFTEAVKNLRLPEPLRGSHLDDEDGDFLTQWNAWIMHRRDEIGEPLTPAEIREQCAQLLELEYDDAADTLSKGVEGTLA